MLSEEESRDNAGRLVNAIFKVVTEAVNAENLLPHHGADILLSAYTHYIVKAKGLPLTDSFVHHLTVQLTQTTIKTVDQYQRDLN
jgi:hypothetical protein